MNDAASGKDYEIPPQVEASNSDSVEKPVSHHGGHEGITSWEATVLIIRGCIGSLFLLMPSIMNKLGYVTGTITVIFAGIIYYHTVHQLLSTEYELSQDLQVKHLSYVDVAEKTFQRSAFPLNKLHSFIEYLIYIFYGLPTTNAGCLVLIANAIQSLTRRYGFNIKTTYIISLEFIPLTCLCLVPNILDILVPYSSVTNIFTLLMASAIIFSSVIQRNESVSLKPFGDIHSIPECMAKCVKASCCTGMILPFKRNMKRPEKMVSTFGCLNVAAAIVIAFYYSFGIILYANYGDQVQENVLFNLPSDSYLSDAVCFLYTASLFATYIIIFFNRHNNVWCGSFKQSFAGKKYELVADYGVRLSISLLAYLLAIGVPNLALITALGGTACFIVEVALPSILDLLSKVARRKTNFWIVCKNFFIIGITFLLFFLSLLSCVKKIIMLYTS